MIASLRGILRALGANHGIVETGGVGFLIYAPRSVLSNLGAIGDEVFLHTLLIVREDALTLYGFATLEQRNFFETLLSVPGIGPKVALNLLSVSTPDEIRLTVAHNDTNRLSRVPGIGKKTAERLILELKSKLHLQNLPDLPADTSPAASTINDELAGLLISLGYSSTEASAAIAALPADAPLTLEERLRTALRYFGSV